MIPAHAAYAVLIREAASETKAAGDQRNEELLLDMLRSLQAGEIERVHRAYAVLRPSYQARLGAPPEVARVSGE